MLKYLSDYTSIICIRDLCFLHNDKRNQCSIQVYFRNFIRPSFDKYNIKQHVIIATLKVQCLSIVLCIPIGITTIERSFSAMIRIMSRHSNRMGQYTLVYHMKISIKSEEDPSQEFIEEAIRFVRNKKRSLHYID